MCEGYELPPKAWLFEPTLSVKKPVALRPSSILTERKHKQPIQLTDNWSSSSSSSSDESRSLVGFGTPCSLCGESRTECICDQISTEMLHRHRSQSLAQTALPSQLVGPYRSPQEQQFFKFFIEVAASSIARSGISGSFWLLAVPEAAWSEPAVRDTLLSISTNFQNLEKEVLGAKPYETTSKLALGYQNKALHSVARDTPSLESVLIIAMGLLVTSMLEGDYGKTLSHAYYATKIVSCVRDRSKHDLLILKYAEGLGSMFLQYFRTTRGPCPLHPGGALLDCDLTCFEPEEMPVEIRVADMLHHLRENVSALAACKKALARRSVPHSMLGRIEELLDKQLHETNFLISCWSDADRLGIPPRKLAEAIAVTPYTASPFPPILHVLMDLINKDHESKVTFQMVELSLRVVMPNTAIATARRSPLLRGDAGTLLFFSSFIDGRLEVTTPWKKEIEKRGIT